MLSREDRVGYLSVVSLTGLFCFVAYRPWHLYFFGDSWDLLMKLNSGGLGAIWLLHNEHFVPVANLLLYIEFVLFGMNNLPYQVVNIVIHILVSCAVYAVCGRFTQRVAPRLFGALLFAFSGTFWEVTLWETEQSISLALLLSLAGILLLFRFANTHDYRWIVACSAASFLACLSMTYGLLSLALTPVAAWAVSAGNSAGNRRILGAGLAASTTALVAFSFFYVTYATGGGAAERLVANLGVRLLVRVPAWIWQAVWEGEIRPLASSAFSPVFVAVVFGIAGAWVFRSVTVSRALYLLVPLTLLVGSHVLTALGRSGSESDLMFASSSRYQYFGMAGLGVLGAWAAALVLDGPRALGRRLSFLAAILIVVSLLVHGAAGIEYIRVHSPRFEWGLEARHFFSTVLSQDACTQAPPGFYAPAPELLLPRTVYPLRKEFATVLPLFLNSGWPVDANPLSIRAVVFTEDVKKQNLLARFSPLVDTTTWRRFGTVGFRIVEGAPTRPRTLELSIAPGGAFGIDADVTTGVKVPYTFAVRARLLSGEPHVSIRLIFKEKHGNAIDFLESGAIDSPEFQTVLVSGLPTLRTAVVAVDIASVRSAAAPAVIEISEVVLVRHPVFVSSRVGLSE